MADIVERLRELPDCHNLHGQVFHVVRDAADEIERLRDQIYESIPKWQANELQREIERLLAKGEAEKTPRHPAEDARDFWYAEAARRLVDLDKTRRELADLERHFGKAIADNAALCAERDSYKGELQNARIYLRRETEHAETAEREVERLREALHRISLGSQNSGTTKEFLGREARAALGEGAPG